MSSIVEFIIRTRDLASGGMQRMAATTRNAVSSVNSSITRMQSRISQTRQPVDQLNGRLDLLSRTRSLSINTSQLSAANRQAGMFVDRMGRLRDGRGRFAAAGGGGGDMGGGGGDRSGGGGGGLMSMLGGGMSRLLGPAAIAAALTAGGVGIAQAAAKQETQMTGLKTFLGEKGAKEAYMNIRSDAAATPFDTDGLLSVNRALITAGASAQRAREDTLNLANAISATGGGNDELQRMAVNMQQIKNTGKATAMDIKQFAFAGINIYQLLADATGKSIDKVKEMDVSYDLLTFALDKAAQKGGLYAGAMEAQSKTLSGKWNTAMDNFKISMADVGTALQPFLVKLLDIGIQFSNSFPKVLKAIQPVIDMLNNANIGEMVAETMGFIGTVLGALGPVIEEFKPVIMTVIKVIWQLVQRARELVLQFLDRFGPTIKNLAHGISVSLVPALKIVGWALGKVFDLASWLIDKLAMLLEPISKLFSYVNEIGAKVMSSFVSSVEQGSNKAVDMVKKNMNRPDLVTYLTRMGNKHGEAYVDASLKKYEVLARWMDKMYSTDFFAKKMAEVRDQLMNGTTLAPVVVVPKIKRDLKAAMAGSGDDEGGKSSGITGGGKKHITINMSREMISGGIHITSQTTNEGLTDFEHRVEEALLRILNSTKTVE